MYKKEFDRYIAQNSLANAIILFGESRFLIERYVDILANMHPDAAKLTFYHDEYNFASAREHLSQNSLFGESNLLIIKTEKKVPKSDLDTLVSICQKNPINHFLYAYYGSDHKTCDKAFHQKAGGMSVRFFHPNHGESVAILRQSAQELSLTIDGYAASHLLRLHNGDLELACAELPKLALHGSDITTQMIDTMVFGLSHIRMDQFIEDILSKREYKENLERLLESGEDEIGIIGAITAFVTQMYHFNTYIRINGAPDSKAILGYTVPAFVLQAKASFSLKFKPRQYFEMLSLLLDAQLAMKSANVEKHSFLFSALIRLQRLL
jgi:DNA polymerase III subunit delta